MVPRTIPICNLIYYATQYKSAIFLKYIMFVLSLKLQIGIKYALDLFYVNQGFFNYLREENMTLFEELKRRGLIAQMSHEKEIEELLNTEKVSFYIGFDATADSLHIGHLLQLVVMKHMQKAGHKPIALLGTGTTLIGDPTGRTDMRKMLTADDINHNAECFRRQMSRFIEFGSGEAEAEMVQNGDWLLKLNYLEFIRDIGVHFSVNKMLTAECYRARFEKGLSFFEFNYMLLQSYDFLHLFKTKGVKLQLGGDDQWSNILAGADLIRRKEKGEAFAMTFTLLATKEGAKMGKSQKGALWLDAEKCSPYDFYQSFRNTDDGDVIKKLKMLTFIPIEEIEEMEKTLSGAELNKAKELLAFEMTKTVHGEEEAKKAEQAAKTAFGSNNGLDNAELPSTAINPDMLTDGKINILDLLTATQLCGSRRDARTTVEQGGVVIDNEKITDTNALVGLENPIVIKKGKKTFHKAFKAE